MQLNVEFRSPKFRTYLMPAFWDGGEPVMVVRFAPTDDGEWTYQVVSNSPAGTTGKASSQPHRLPRCRDSFVPRNVHHWAYADSDRPHLWMGDSELRLRDHRQAQLTRLVDARTAQKFTHFRGSVMSAKDSPKPAFAGPDKPNPEFFRAVDERVTYINFKGLVADLVLGCGSQPTGDTLPHLAAA